MKPETCLKNLVGLKQLCNSVAIAPQFYLDDIEGIDQAKLAKLASEIQGSGKKMATDIIESAARLVMADIESSIPSNFMLTKEIVSICSSCTQSNFFTGVSANGTGIVVKNLTNSKFSKIHINSLVVKINNTGTFTLRIRDGKTENNSSITQEFVAGEETVFSNINYSSGEKTVKIYFDDPAVSLSNITCPANSGCGCGASNNSTMTKDIMIMGLSAGIETTQQYGILPCVMISCNYDAIVCNLITSTPKIFGLALLYRCASKIFDENSKSTRVNRQASFDKEYIKTESERFEDLYRERMYGKPRLKILGITEVINKNLSVLKDKCITCSSNPFGVAHATG